MTSNREFFIKIDNGWITLFSRLAEENIQTIPVVQQNGVMP